MLFVVNHLTRMQQGFICVAGLDMATGRSIRPMLRGRMSSENLARHGGLFDMARIIDLGPTRLIGSPPETEDRLFYPMSATVVSDHEPGAFWKLLEKQAQAKLSTIFGKELVKIGTHSCGVDIGKGEVSLGCLKLT